MSDEKIWLSSPHMGGEELKYIHEAFEQNWIAPLGPNVNEFEKSLEDYLGNNVSVAALSSGTAAIHLGLKLLDVQAGDEVICQSMTFAASANPIQYLGAKPIFVDSEIETWNICPQALEDAIKDRIKKGVKPKAIIGVHLYGMPYQHKEIREISEKYEIPVLEDSAEALGSFYDGRACGTLGDIGILSFNGNKIITTSGGGALVAHSEGIKNKAVFLATQARDDAPHYQHSEIGHNYRLSNVSAGIGRGQMKVLNQWVEARRQVFEFYKGFLKDFEQIVLQSNPSDKFSPNRWLTALYFDDKNGYDLRENLRLKLLEKSIESRPLWKPMHLQPVFKDFPYYGSSVSENLFSKGICLPSGSNLTLEEKDRIKRVIIDIL
ncbi:UDP-4-amino-4-deoxy-L-arabinose--oxoglutarate aminotransferase [Candidatus Ornithobacterium hominis]|uniref:UDP-4-amino-4-deoxy-L-arabinose--oxoglutarate aminotransferase n=1 Tax=Candidatus Ornithobacterium hominis TaxID=2497989 RepID=A0A383TVP7_9FLAO|nr:aminotransferase class I/II-fold pyridoxal phosphate-dependent enzyme [Candidatus Ornithobacterium hominis]MCT7904510.1 aminotransferase class I/II-fold pyridoxal phosphate-dependent enzyme [Candidatus Ornithobacterium hominis]SZD71407.1 UDP-4-amino-4-deoxy-L-arabinose--oxoglutarate aminotransferase [Candidatus Ornithobacterium hominis]SZD72088.1 UDP-4-amino-4-deoxy-L-arabinose--oxoglutarate aminotransferase [Candidatus Ornithobacterium hominis]